MSPAGRKNKVVLLLSASVVLAMVTACSKQGEGERCDARAAGNADCESGLICDTQLNRCCPPEGARITDSRCNRSAATGGRPSSSGGTGGTAGTTATGGVSGSAGSDAGNAGTTATNGGAGGAPDEPEAGSAGESTSSGAGGA